MKIIDGNGAVLGRLASYVAKEALSGEDVVILNCEHVIITGSKNDIRERFEIKRRRIGSGQKGPKYPRDAEMVVKRVIRGMLPNHRGGRGKVALSKVKCFIGVPKEYENAKKIVSGKEKAHKHIRLSEITKHAGEKEYAY